MTENDIAELLEKGEKPFRQYVGICASGQSVKTTLIRLYSVLLQEAFILSEDPKYQNYVDPYYTLVGYFNSIRELGGAVRLLDDDINSRLKVLRKKYKNARQRYLGFDGKKEITSRIPSYQIAEILEKLAEPFDPSKERQSCYDVVIATNMIAVGMDVDRLGLMAVVGQPKQNSEYIQATSRVGRKYPGIIFTVYNPYRPRDFPYTHVCTNDRCKRLFDIREELKNTNYLENYKQHQGSASCPDCHYSAYPARFISICEDGHMDAFPWRWWCHNGKTDCKEKLRLKSFGTTSSLAELEVECDCGAKRRMSGSMQKENFDGCNCTGNHPQRPNAIKKICKKKIVPSQRGASNVYFPVTRTAISIPPWTNPINDLMAEHRRDIDLLIEVLGRDAGLNKSYEKYFEGKFTRDEFNEAYNRLEQNIKDYVELKEMEYNAITHHQQVEFQHDVRYFKAEEVAIKDSLKKYFSRVIKLHRLREVKVLLGYSRLEMPEPEVDDQKQVVKLKSSGPEKWLPAVEINGEGIFIEFNRATMNEWLTNSRVAERSKKYESCYEEYCKQKGWENFKSRNGEYVLIHTLSHMLIKEMAIQSGYSSSALHERIYSSDKMCGLLIYTGAADKEGSLGGLVELGSMEKLIPLLKGALENGLTCTTDPECFMKNPTTDRINGAACHSCTMISETACENGNRLLDRALVVPLPEHEEMGYFKELVNVLCGIQV